MCLFSLRKLFCDLFTLFFVGFVLFCSSISAAQVERNGARGVGGCR